MASMQDTAAPVHAGTVRPALRLVRGQPTSDGAGVKLTRVIGTAALGELDPFLMLDEFRSDSAGAKRYASLPIR